jgi:hypothetical protein
MVTRAWLGLLVAACGGATQEATHSPPAREPVVVTPAPPPPLPPRPVLPALSTLPPATTAEEAFQRGQDYFIARRFEEAAACFARAYELKPAPTFLYNQGVCFEKLQQYRKAVELFRAYLDAAHNPRDAARVQERIKRDEDAADGHPVRVYENDTLAPA